MFRWIFINKITKTVKNFEKGQLDITDWKPKQFHQNECVIKQSAWIFILQGSTGRLQSSSSNQFVRDLHYKLKTKNHTHAKKSIMPRVAFFIFIFVFKSNCFQFHKQNITKLRYTTNSHDESDNWKVQITIGKNTPIDNSYQESSVLHDENHINFQKTNSNK